MLTLNEIRNVNFRKANFGGYRAEDVEAFIDEVQLSYDTLLRENAELVKRLEVLAAKLEEYQGEEDSIRNALMNAQKVGDASLRDAKHKAEIILKDATIKAEKIVANAQSEIHNERDIIERMQRDIAEFKTKLLKAYKDHLTLINNIPNEEIMRPDTKEMVESVQMLDRRASNPEYDSGENRAAHMQPTRERADMPADREAAFGSDAVTREDSRAKRAEAAREREAAAMAASRASEAAMSQAAPQTAAPQAPQMPVMPVDKAEKRRGGFTVGIDEPGTSGAAPADMSGARYPGRFNNNSFDGNNADIPADTTQFQTMKTGEQPTEDEQMSTPASLFKRRRPQ